MRCAAVPTLVPEPRNTPFPRTCYRAEFGRSNSTDVYAWTTELFLEFCNAGGVQKIE